MLLTSGDVDIKQMTNLFNKIIADNKVLEGWDRSVIVNNFKNKSDATERGNYKGLKLIEHMMKVFERAIKQRELRGG